MSFSGKKFRRTRCENIEEFMRVTKEKTTIKQMMLDHPPVFSFIRLDEKTFIFKLILQSRVMSQRFRLDEEFEMQKHNGQKIKITYSLEGDSVLNEVIKLPDGKMLFFRREFGNSNKMIVFMEGMTRPTIIHYELIN